MNNEDFEAREIEEECTIERVKAAMGGEMGIAKMDDAMRRATPLVESGTITPFAFNLIGTIHRGHDDGLSLTEMKARFIQYHDANTRMTELWEPAVEQLRQHSLLPERLVD